MKKIFSIRIKQMREGLGLCQAELAEKLKVSVGLISLWEAGKRDPSMSSLISLASFFHVSIDYIVGISDD